MSIKVVSFIEVHNGVGWEHYSSISFECHNLGGDVRQPFRDKNYNLFGWIADVKNYSKVTPFTHTKTLPDNLSTIVSNNIKKNCLHTFFFTRELLRVDYSQIVEDRRKLIYSKGDYTVDKGKGFKMKLSDYLGVDVMNTIDKMKEHFEKTTALTRIIMQFGRVVKLV